MYSEPMIATLESKLRTQPSAGPGLYARSVERSMDHLRLWPARKVHNGPKMAAKWALGMSQRVR